MEKKIPETLAGLLACDSARGRTPLLMFQDEARFGRMVRLRRCWAPAPLRPVLSNAYQREYTYVYGAVGPKAGCFDWMFSEHMNTVQMGVFLARVGMAHPEHFIVMVVDGASSHVSKDLQVPENMCLLRLPPYSPELNPCENIWDELREKLFPNRVYSSMQEVVSQLEAGLPAFAKNHSKIQSMTGRDWIINAI